MIIIASIAVLIHLSIAVYLFFHRPHTWNKRIFAAVSIQLAAWSFVHVVGNLISGHSALLIISRASLITVLFVPAAILLFFLNYHTFLSKARWVYWAIFVPPLLMLPFSFGSLNAPGFIDNEIVYEKVLTGPIYNVFIPYFALFLSIALIIHLIKLRKEKSKILKLQMKYILWGLLIPATLGIINNAILPHWFGFYTNTFNGVISSVIFPITVAYAITRYRFFNISIRLTRELVQRFGKWIGYFLIAFTILIINSHAPTSGPFLLALILGAALLVFDLAWQKVHFKISGIIPPNGFDFSRVEKFPRKFQTEDNFIILLKDIKEQFSSMENIGRVSLFSYLQPQERWIEVKQLPLADNRALLQDHIIPLILQRQKREILMQELEVEGNSELSAIFSNNHERKSLINEMYKMGFDILIPVWGVNNELQAFIGLQLKEDKTMLHANEISKALKITSIVGSWITAVLSHHYAVLGAEKVSAAGSNSN